MSISDYLALSRLARDEFKPVAAVFLITDGDFSESLGERLGNYFFKPDQEALVLKYAPMFGDSPMKKIRKSIGDISIYRYFMANLGFSLDGVLSPFRANATTKTTNVRAVQDADLQKMVADKFLAELPESLGVPQKCIVFLMDSDRYAIYNPKLASSPKDRPEVRSYFIEQAEKLGFMVSDLDRVFRKSYSKKQTKYDYWPVDRHWSRVGHGVGAQEASQLLSSNEQRECLPGRLSRK